MSNKKTKIAVGVVVLATVTMVGSRLLEFPWIEVAAKMTASSAFVVLAVILGAGRSRYGCLILTGLVLSWFGDMFLAAATERFFLFGLASFLLAHVAYTSAFVSVGINRNRALGALAAVALLSTGSALWLDPFVPAEMAIPVRIYTVVISLMVVAAAGSRGGSLLIPVGAVLFYFSDLSVAAGQFVQTGFPNYLWGLPFYFCAQVLFALSVGKFQPGPAGIQERADRPSL